VKRESGVSDSTESLQIIEALALGFPPLYSIIECKETRDLVVSLYFMNARIPQSEIPSLVGRHACI